MAERSCRQKFYRQTAWLLGVKAKKLKQKQRLLRFSCHSFVICQHIYTYTIFRSTSFLRPQDEPKNIWHLNRFSNILANIAIHLEPYVSMKLSFSLATSHFITTYAYEWLLAIFAIGSIVCAMYSCFAARFCWHTTKYNVLPRYLAHWCRSYGKVTLSLGMQKQQQQHLLWHKSVRLDWLEPVCSFEFWTQICITIFNGISKWQ